MAIFGSGTPVSKVVTGGFPVFVASFARMLTAAVVLIPLMVLVARRDRPGWERAVPRMPAADWARIAAIAVAGMFLFSVFMLYGMKEASGAVGGIVMATTPAVTAVGAILFLGDRLDRWKAAAIAAAVAGILAVNLGGVEGDGGDVLLGSALVFGAVCGEAAYTLLGKRVSADLEPIAIAALAAAGATVLFAIPAALQLGDLEWSAVDASEWIALAWWGLGTMAVGSVLWYSGVARAPGITASAFMGVMPVSALLLSYLLLGESFEWVHLIGMAAVLAGIAAMVEGERRTEAEESS